MEITRNMKRTHQTSNSTVSCTNSDLPIDLIFDIFSRLPVKPLLRFKSVSKTFYSLIENPNFIKKHQTMLRRNHNQALSSVLVSGHVSKSTMYSLWLLCWDKSDNYNNNNNNIQNVAFEYNPKIVCIFDGLVCATFGNSEVIICNPTIGRVRRTSQFSFMKLGLEFVFFGIGFQDNEYNLFRILYSGSWDGVVVRAEVYSIGKDIWREIEVKTKDFHTRVHLMDCGFCKSTTVAINGVFYCGGCIPSYTCVVASFDMNGYVFDLIECPSGLIRRTISWWQLIDLKGKLALTTCSGTHWFEMWVLGENRNTWTRKLRTNTLPSIGRRLRSVGCGGNNKLVMRYYLLNGAMRLFSFDTESYEIVYLPFPKINDCQDVYLYTESLLLV